MIKIDYNPKVHCDVCEGTGEAQLNLSLLFQATRCYYCKGSGKLPLCKICLKNGVWSTAISCVECESNPYGEDLDLVRPEYRSHITKEIVEEICINPDHSIDIYYHSSLAAVDEFRHKQILSPSETQLRHFLETFPVSSAEKFDAIKESLMGI